MNKILHFGRSGVKGAVVCVAFAALGVLASSCVRRDLYVKPDEGGVLLDFDWQKLAPGEAVPEQMTIYFYGANGSLTRGLTENGKFSGTLPSGNYKVLVLNENVQGVGFTNMEDFDRAYAYALPLNKRAEGDDMWIREPGWLYSANIGELAVTKEDTVQRTLVPKPLVRRVVLNIRLTGDTHAVTGVSAALTGVAPSVRLATGLCGDGYASITELDPQPTEDGYSANVLVFGVAAINPDGSPADNSVRLDLDFSNGGSQAIEENISNGGIVDPTEIEININMDIEVAATSTAGFSAKVTKWEVTEGGMNVDNRPGGVPLAGHEN